MVSQSGSRHKARRGLTSSQLSSSARKLSSCGCARSRRLPRSTTSDSSRPASRLPVAMPDPTKGLLIDSSTGIGYFG